MVKKSNRLKNWMKDNLFLTIVLSIFGFFILIIIIVAGMFSFTGSVSDSSPAPTNKDKVADECLIKVEGGGPISFSGSVGSITHSRTISGRTRIDSPLTYLVDCGDITTVIQKTQGGGTLTVSILANGEVLNFETTSAPYGVITLSARS